MTESRMPSGELKMAREFLGLTLDELAAILGVRQDTLRRWESGKEPVPYKLWDEIQAVEEATSDAIGQIVTQLNDMRDPQAEIYRTDDAFWTALPALRQFSARWWRHCVARACLEVPGVQIVDVP